MPRTSVCSQKQAHAEVIKRFFQLGSLHLICMLIHQTGHLRIHVFESDDSLQLVE